MKSRIRVPLVALIVSVGCIALLSSGCIRIGKPAPAKNLYRLQTQREGQPAEGLKSIVLTVAPVQVPPPFSGKNFIYRTEEFSYEVDSYNLFLQSPELMIREETTSWMRDAGSLSPMGSKKEACTLVLQVGGFYGDFRNLEAPQAVLQMEAIVKDARGRVLYDTRFEKSLPIGSRRARDLVASWSAALEAILKSIETDIPTAVASQSL